MKGTDDLAGRFLSIVSARFLTTVIAILSTPVIVRLLGPGRYGDYAVLLAVFSLYMIPVSGAITEGVQKYVAEHRETSHWRERVIRFYGLLGGGIVLVAAAALLAFTAAGAAEALFGDRFSLYFYLLVALVLVSQYRALARHTVLGFGLEYVSGPLDVLKKFVTVSLGIALVAVGWGVGGMLVGHIVANVAVGLAGTYVVARRVSLGSLVGPVAGSFPRRELVSFNAMNVLLVFLMMSMYHVDVIMLRTLVGSETTGIYRAALSLAEYLWAVPLALQTVLLHSSSTLWSDDRDGEITALAGRVTRYTTLLVVLLAVGLAALADSLVPLYYGEPFAPATGPLLLLLPGAVGFAIARPLRAISQGSGRTAVLVLATGVAAALNLGLNALLIPAFGMHGAAVATSVGYGSMFALLVWAAWRIGYDPLEDFRGTRIAAAAVAATPPIVLLAGAIEGDVLSLVVVPPIGLAVYATAAVLAGAVEPAELRQIAARLQRPLGSAVESEPSWGQ